MRKWVVYLLRCSDGSLYCGVTNDMKKRLVLHKSGKASKYTRARLPVRLAVKSRPVPKIEAMRHEYRIKQLDKTEKRRVVKAI
ncbi:MAG: GIY-YIG nuclease family protein [Nitrospinae bacterium]|nr:GIY-YIG nuclease family protein [Nitrospinota bacterium]